mmetsp:Transcript_1279/g.5037  ORF Transcript_1279/g.5037 Transcript_1279/m.5037 type:complete len:245 (+) Transcript_1279:616-1350(+)
MQTSSEGGTALRVATNDSHGGEANATATEAPGAATTAREHCARQSAVALTSACPGAVGVAPTDPDWLTRLAAALAPASRSSSVKRSFELHQRVPTVPTAAADGGREATPGWRTSTLACAQQFARRTEGPSSPAALRCGSIAAASPQLSPRKLASRVPSAGDSESCTDTGIHALPEPKAPRVPTGSGSTTGADAASLAAAVSRDIGCVQRAPGSAGLGSPATAGEGAARTTTTPRFARAPEAMPT